MKLKSLSFALLSTMLLTGCAGDASISYVENSDIPEKTTVEKTIETYENREWNANKLDGAKWEEQYTVNAGNGKEYIIKFNTEISAPYDLSNILVYEYDYIKTFSAERREEIIRNIFGNETIYLYSDEFIPKQYWKKNIDIIKETLAYQPSENEAYWRDDEALLEALERYEEFYEKAPDELVPAQDFSENKYLGYIDGIPYSIGFEFYDVIDKNYETFKELNGSEDIFYFFGQGICMEVETDLYEGTASDEKLSEEEVDKIVDDYMTKFKITDYTQIEGLTPNYSGWDETFFFVQGTKTYESENRAIDGGNYCTDAVAVKLPDGEEKEINILEISSKIVFNFENKLLERVSVNGYMDINDIKENVKLLAFDDIVSIVKAELDNNILEYETDGTKLSYNRMELGYTEAVSGDGNKIGLVPCWRLSSSYKLGKTIYVNAIDGTILDKEA